MVCSVIDVLMCLAVGVWETKIFWTSLVFFPLQNHTRSVGTKLWKMESSVIVALQNSATTLAVTLQTRQKVNVVISSQMPFAGTECAHAREARKLSRKYMSLFVTCPSDITT